jgi:hypothetical protein
LINPVSAKLGCAVSIKTQVLTHGVGGILEKMPRMIASCLWVANTKAGRTFVEVRSEKGKRTSQTSPALGCGIINPLFWVVPLLKAAFRDLHHFIAVKPFLNVVKKGNEILGGELECKLLDLLDRRWDISLRHGIILGDNCFSIANPANIRSPVSQTNGWESLETDGGGAEGDRSGGECANADIEGNGAESVGFDR